MAFDPTREIFDLRPPDGYSGVNPAISDSATFVFPDNESMHEAFEHEKEGCFLYGRHCTPSGEALSEALAKMEGAEAALVTGSGMAAISTTVMQLCKSGDEIVSSRTIYGGTYALFKNFLPKFGVKVRFVDIRDLEAVEAAITDKTVMIYCEGLSNPLLEVADIPNLSEIAHEHGILLVVDNTFTPLVLSPLRLGADVVVHSLTKFINGMNDSIGGCVCGDREFISALRGVNTGATMLLGPVLDSIRAASILKNLYSLHLRIKQHSANALYVANGLEAMGVRAIYPGLASHDQHALMEELVTPGFGYGGMVAVDFKEYETACRAVVGFQEEKVGYLAVSLGYVKTLFSLSGSSTSSEIPPEEQEEMGLSSGLVRMSVGIENDIETSFERIKSVLLELQLNRVAASVPPVG